MKLPLEWTPSLPYMDTKMNKLSEQRAAIRAERDAAIKIAQARCKHGDAWIAYGPLSWRGEASTWQCAKCGKDKAQWAAEADKWGFKPYFLRDSFGDCRIVASHTLAGFSGWEILDPTTYKPLGVVP